MFRWSLSAILSVLAMAAMLAPQALAAKQDVKIIKQWQGSVADEGLASSAPDYIADAGTLTKLWKKWSVAGDVPKVDFSKEIVIVTTTVGSRLSLSARLDDKGNLEALGAATRDIVPGFRYVIGTVSRAGVKTINGKALQDKP